MYLNGFKILVILSSQCLLRVHAIYYPSSEDTDVKKASEAFDEISELLSRDRDDSHHSNEHSGATQPITEPLNHTNALHQTFVDPDSVNQSYDKLLAVHGGSKRPHGSILSRFDKPRAYDNDGNRVHGVTIDDCKVYLPPSIFTLPIPFTYSASEIFLPDGNGNLRIKKNTTFQLSCTNNAFVLRQFNHQSEISVTCLYGNRFLYNNSAFKYQDFLCKSIPQSRIVVSKRKKCQHNHTVASVGFQTKHKFFPMYHVCFDVRTTSTMYAWYYATSPYITNRKTFPTRTALLRSRYLYGSLDIHMSYKKQHRTFINNLGDSPLLKQYYSPNQFTYLLRSFLLERTEFFYGFQQDATAYFENTTPIFYNFYNDIWKHVHTYMSSRVCRGNSKHMIMSGSYGVLTLTDLYNLPRPMFLAGPERIPVPKFVWKVDKIDFVSNRTEWPIAIIGLNSPLEHKGYPYKHSNYICKPIKCPENMQEILKRAKGRMVYCCKVRDFEKIFGSSKPMMYDENEI